MGVKGCFRSGCENIMCDVYISGVGYICSDCEREFKEYMEKNNIQAGTEHEIIIELKKFMDIKKGTYDIDKTPMTVDDLFNKNRS